MCIYLDNGDGLFVLQEHLSYFSYDLKKLWSCYVSRSLCLPRGQVVEGSGWGWEHFGVKTAGAAGQVFARHALDYENEAHRRGFRIMIQVTDRVRACTGLMGCGASRPRETSTWQTMWNVFVPRTEESMLPLP